jgi:glycosyltransferase involved in cell wall biosynthesis/peptidoglycan/xylan/chitin deacetylase (PgdA/CDA1 family)
MTHLYYQLRNRLFYSVKPAIPRSFQIVLRQLIARQKRVRYRNVWPIDVSADKPPERWPGWPEGKRFALALSHDVDTLKGYRDVPKLADLEEKLGFRSVFNFVPERYGKISDSLLDDLKSRGFGIGLHGLKHDGKLFLSKNLFDRRATKLKVYLQKWGARGFTSPSMLRNLEWLSTLPIDYSISTFDTDPFEPQPEGTGTIFPFWVPANPPNQGFVELPYTLPQDFTLFIILGEKNNTIWKQKLNWIAKKGGMALINTHTDYMNFSHPFSYKRGQYPVQYYIDFLEYAKNLFYQSFWHVLPNQISTFFKKNVMEVYTASNETRYPSTKKREHTATVQNQPSKKLRVAMLSYSFYESDNRVRRYAETLSRRGDDVDVYSLRRKDQRIFNKLNNVNIFRIQERVRNEKGKLSYLFRILKFLVFSSIKITLRHLKKPYDVIHVHSVPDFEVFAALIPKLLGARIILDIHDIVPELYANKFKIGNNSVTFKLLKIIEKISAGFSDHVIISNHLWRKTITKRSVSKDKCTAILNYPDPHIFFKSLKPKHKKDKQVFLYPGTLNHHQGLDIAIKALNLIRNRAPEAQLHIYGEGPSKDQLRELIQNLDMNDRVFLKRPVPLNDIVPIMSKADFGIIPKRNDSFGGTAFSTKTLEFMSIGIPIILSRTTIDQYYYDDSVVKFFEPGNEKDLAKAMLNMIENPINCQKQAEQSSKFVEGYNWSNNQSLYLNIINSLIKG